MKYKEIRNLVEKLGNENYEDFIKAIVSFEKGINDMDALDKIYSEFMDSDIKGLLHEDFDYMIDELRENGEIKDAPFVSEEKDNLVNIVGNLVEDAEVLNRKTKEGKEFTVVNFTVLSNEEGGLKVYSDCSAYGNKSDIPKDFKKGDFVKIFGEIRRNIDDKGKEYSNVRVLSSKLLKAKEQMKNNEKSSGKSKDSVLGAIQKYKAEDKAKSTEAKKSDKQYER